MIPSKGRQAVLFSIVFFLLFLLFLSTAVIYSNHLRSLEASRAISKRAIRDGAIAANVASNIRSLIGFSIGVNRSEGNLTVSLSDSFSPAIPIDLNSYATFVNSSLLKKLNSNGTLAVSSLAQNPKLIGGTFNYSWNSLLKNESNFSFLQGALVSGGIKVSFSGPSDTDETGWTWQSCLETCPSGEFFLRLEIENSTGSQVSPKGCSYGCLELSGTNSIVLNGTGNPFNLTVSGEGFQISADPAFQVSIEENATISSEKSIEAYFPAYLSIDGRSNFTRLVLLEA